MPQNLLKTYDPVCTKGDQLCFALTISPALSLIALKMAVLDMKMNLRALISEDRATLPLALRWSSSDTLIAVENV
ncbi:hypothetical protein BDZ45DRAFT_345180 [Acephala macrosclerotiorum]|nr:hypothetical protein BDZ45DRAFT_345180 [Acephala macrosclerotiorum]